MGYEYPGYNLQNYCEDQAVFVIQEVLYNIGYAVGVIDGKFGTNTQQVVMNFQANNGLAVDGIVGPNTWGYLMSCVGC